MPTQEEIAHQQILLIEYRRTLAHYVMQKAMLGEAYIPPGVSHGIREARDNIRLIKSTLRGWGVLADDDPADELSPSQFTYPDEQIFKSFIEEKTRGFVGRQFVFDAVTQFTNSSPRGYFRIIGEPGIGKSALAAHMINTSSCIHHFNISAQGTGQFDRFARNIYPQIIAKYKLNHHILSEESARNPGLLARLLHEAAQKLQSSEKLIIVVDALDEVDSSDIPQGANTLYLPPILPNGVYVICTMRKNDPNVILHVECEHDAKEIRQDDPENIADIRHYIELSTKGRNIQQYIASQGINDTMFIEHLTRKSQGNFLYLRYILPAIENGAYKDLKLEALPEGLSDHYDRYWKRMKGLAGDDWFRYKLPIIMALTVKDEPISIELIADFSRVQERSRIRATLQEWEQFLYPEQVRYEGSVQTRYRLYHSTFCEFIAEKEEIKDEKIDSRRVIETIANDDWRELFGDK